MITNIDDTLKKYFNIFPNEKEKLKQFSSFLENNKSNLFNRKNFEGHITASGYIFSLGDRKILLLEHKQLNVYVQPGGHIEEDDNSILDAAKREVYEETGLKDLKLLNIDSDINVPLDINSHYIPKNDTKKEEEHYHHDFSYLFVVNQAQDINIDANESNNYKWCGLEDFKDERKIKDKILKVIEEI